MPPARPLSPASARTQQPRSALPAVRSYSVRYQKPPECAGCRLEHSGIGFVPPSGSVGAPILLLGENPAYDEAATGEPFKGAAGSMLYRILKRNNWAREQFRIGNSINCVAPGLKLGGTDYEDDAVNYCRRYTEPLLAEPHQVVVPLGGTAIRRVLGLARGKGVRVQDFHGTVSRDPADRFWVVPSYHPSFLQRGAHNLIGTVSFDLQLAHDVAAQGWRTDPARLVVDPSPAWFDAWADLYLHAAALDPDGIWLNTDVETDDKAGGRDEGELGPEDQSYNINRWNFGCHPDEGVTVPDAEPYRATIARILASPGVKLFWNGGRQGYDYPRIRARGYVVNGEIWDLMWFAHMLQSDLPRGLGFWAPFYSSWGPWKHLAASDPGTYGAIDGFQPVRVAYGVVKDLVESGMWEACHRHVYELETYALTPAREIGLEVDQEELQRFKTHLTTLAADTLAKIQDCVPVAERPLTGGTTRPPKPGQLHDKARTHTLKGIEKKDPPDPLMAELFARESKVEAHQVTATGYCCKLCGAEGVAKTHRCDVKRDRDLELREYQAVRYFWREPFNPNSPPQLLRYIKAKGHTPGKAKGTGKESTDRETLERLARETGDPLYARALDLRAITKVRSTYVIATKRLMDAEGRIHPIPTFRPSTGRMSYISPNITNVVADKGAEKGGRVALAAGYRKCLRAGRGKPKWVTAADLERWRQRWVA